MRRDYYFFRYLTRASARELEPTLPEGYELKMFVPKWPHIIPPLYEPKSKHYIFGVWWLMRVCGGLRNPDAYRVFAIYKDMVLAHYMVVLPWNFKYGFMNANDLWLGPGDTHIDHRRKGLAMAAVTAIKKEFADLGAYLWWICRVDNLPSRKAAEKCGFEEFAIGEKKIPFGLEILGTYHLDSKTT